LPAVTLWSQLTMATPTTNRSAKREEMKNVQLVLATALVFIAPLVVRGQKVTQLSQVVDQATPAIIWPAPSAITYGTALTATQLNATVTGYDGNAVAGTFTYSPASGTILTTGTQTLTVTFTPADTTNYSSSTKTIYLTVNQATPSITWALPAAITYGTALSDTQLSAKAGGYDGSALHGTYSYSPASGELLSAGIHMLTVSFTPADAVNYTAATKSVSLTVNQATPTMIWTTPAAITYGTALSAIQLNATATGYYGNTLPGAFAYSPAAGAVLSAGTHDLAVVFVPTDSSNYTSATTSVNLSVNKASTTITGGTSLGTSIFGDSITFAFKAAPRASGINPTGTLTIADGTTTLGTIMLTNGTASYTTSALTAGNHSIVATYNGDSNYE